MKKLMLVLMFLIIVLSSGCTGSSNLDIAGVRDLEVDVGSSLPDFLDGVSVVGSVGDQRLNVDSSAVNMDVLGNYDVVYYIEVNDEVLYEKTIILSVVDRALGLRPEISGITSISYSIGDDMPDLYEGITVLDPNFGDITPALMVDDGKVLYDTIGRYYIDYTVRNDDGYYHSLSREINVVGGGMFTLPDSFYLVNDANHWGIINYSNEIIVPIMYDQLSYIGEGIVKLVRNDIVYYYNSTKNEYFQSEYDILGYSSNGLALAKDSNNFLGFVDVNGLKVLEFIYTYGNIFIDGEAIVGTEESIGIIDSEGEVLLDLKHNELHFLNDELIYGITGDRTVIYNLDFELLFECETLDLNEFTVDEESYYFFTDGDKTGVVDSQFNVVLEAVYDSISVEDGIAELVLSVVEVGLYSFSSDILVTRIDSYNDLDNGFAVYSDRLCGLLDSETLEVIIPQTYQYIFDYSSTLVKVQDTDNHLGLIDMDNNTVLGFDYNIMTKNGETRWTAYSDSGAYLLDLEGNVLTSALYNSIATFNDDGYSIVYVGAGNYGMIDLDGNEVLAPHYQMIDGFHDGYLYLRDANVLGGNNQGVLDTEFNVVLPFMYNQVLRFSEGVFAVKLDGSDSTSSGYVDKNNVIVMPLTLYSVRSFKDGVAVVGDSTTSYRYIYSDFSSVPGGSYYYAYDFHINYGVVRTDSGTSSFGVVNFHGDTVVSDDYKHISPFEEGYFVVRKSNDKYNYVGIDDEELLNYDFDIAYSFKNGVGVVRGGSDVAAYNTNGKLIISNMSSIIVGDERVLAINHQGKYGLFDFDGNELTGCLFNSSLFLNQGYSKACIDAESCGIITMHGHTMLPLEFEFYSHIENGYVFETLDDDMFTIEIIDGMLTTLVYDEDGELVASVEYNDGLILRDHEDNSIDLQNNKYDAFVKYETGYFVFIEDGKYMYVDWNGDEVFEGLSSSVTSLGDGYLLVELNGNWGIYHNGIEIVPSVYDGLTLDIDAEIIYVRNGNFYAIYNLNGDMTIPFEYSIIEHVTK